MQSIVRKVKDIERDERCHLEKVLGRKLTDDQQLVIQVIELPPEPATGEKAKAVQPPDRLPEWCNVYEGLTVEEIAEIEEIILTRADMSRSLE